MIRRHQASSLKLIYQISLPLKNRQAPVPNNISQAMQRANWLKRKLKREPRLLEDYKVFMEDIVSKGYTRKVHLIRIASNKAEPGT